MAMVMGTPSFRGIHMHASAEQPCPLAAGINCLVPLPIGKKDLQLAALLYKVIQDTYIAVYMDAID